MKTQKIEQIVITPEMANEFLEKSEFNGDFRQRKLNTRTIDYYAEAMRAGEWIPFTNDCILIDDEDRIINGQHRLSACVKSGKPFASYIVFNADSSLIHVADKGVPRTIPGDFYINGAKNVSTLSTVIKLLYCANKYNGYLTISGIKLMYHQAKKVLEAYPDVESIVNLCKSKKYGISGITYAMNAFLATIINEECQDKAWEFIEKTKTGEELKKRCPILALRNLSSMWARSSYQMPRMEHRLNVYVRAWNLYAQGKQASYLRMDSKKQKLFEANLKQRKCGLTKKLIQNRE